MDIYERITCGLLSIVILVFLGILISVMSCGFSAQEVKAGGNYVVAVPAPGDYTCFIIYANDKPVGGSCSR